MSKKSDNLENTKACLFLKCQYFIKLLEDAKSFSLFSLFVEPSPHSLNFFKATSDFLDYDSNIK